MLPLCGVARVHAFNIERNVFLALCVASLILLSAGFAAPARGVTIDFEGLDHGEILSGDLSLGPGGVIQSITTVNLGGGPDIAIIFDSTERGTVDGDLEGPNDSGGGSWDGGNLAPDTYLGNLLIISEDARDDNDDGRIDDPDDEGSKPAGYIHIVFDQAYTDFGFDLVDIEDNLETMGSIEFFFDDESVGEIDFEDLASLQPDISFGNNTANRIQLFNTMDTLQVDAFQSVIFRFGGSGALTNIALEPIPEPGTAMLLGLGLVAMAGNRARARDGRLSR